MIFKTGSGPRRTTQASHVRLPAWQVDLAASGLGRARTTTGSGSGQTTITLREQTQGRLLTVTPSGRSPLTEMLLGPDGIVRIRSCDAPPVLLIGDGAETRYPLVGKACETGVAVPEGSLLFACSPSLLDAMEPLEVLAAPRLLWLSKRPSFLLRRWISAADIRGPGGAVALVRRTTSVPAVEGRSAKPRTPEDHRTGGARTGLR
jgi:hypothetical protein